MAQLDEVLSRLNSALRAGDLEQAGAVSAMLETISVPSEPDALRRAARLARENVALAEAAARGVRAAARRLRDLSAAPALATYDTGGKRVLRATPPTEAKRI